MTFEIARYRPEFRPGVIALLPHLVSALPEVNDAYFRWKHETNPYLPAPLVYVALSGGAVVGMRAFQGALWRLGADAATASWPCACDFVVDPAHRGNKLFRRIMDFALADLAEHGFGPVLNWSASPITYGASRRTGWRLLGPYEMWARHTPRARLARNLAQRLRRLPLAWRVADLPVSLGLRRGFGALDKAWARRAARSGITMSPEPRVDEMADLVRRTAMPRIGHVRDAGYYRWRFGNPLSEYRFVYSDRSGLQGFLVLRTARLGDHADVSVVDWAASDPEDFGSSMARVVETGGYDRLGIWTATQGAEHVALLRRLGLAPEDATRGLADYLPGLLAIGPRGAEVTRGDAIAAANLAGLDRWDLRPIYSDFY